MKQLPTENIWGITKKITVILLGTAICSFSFALFQLPFNLAAGGINGIAIFINHWTQWPVGLWFFILNIPMLILGYIYLGKWRFLSYTIIGVVAYSIFVEFYNCWLPQWLPQYPITNDLLLSSIYAGLIGGIGYGLVIRVGGSLAGTGVVGLIIQKRTGYPLSQVYLYTDGAIIFTAGLIFGWEIALHALLVLFISGYASDFALEGSSTVRTATIITDHPEELIPALKDGLKRGVSFWDITGGHSRASHKMILCTINRSQVALLKEIVSQNDPQAFLTIGIAQQAIGSSFKRHAKQISKPNPLPTTEKTTKT